MHPLMWVSIINSTYAYKKRFLVVVKKTLKFVYVGRVFEIYTPRMINVFFGGSEKNP